MRSIITYLLCICICIISFSQNTECSPYTFYYSGLIPDNQFANQSSDINNLLQSELGSLVTITSNRSAAQLVVSGTITIQKEKIKKQLGDDDGKQFLTVNKAKLIITVKAIVRNGEDNSYLRSFTKTFQNTDKKSALRQLARQIASVTLPEKNPAITNQVPEKQEREKKKTKPFKIDLGFNAPFVALSSAYLQPLGKYGDTIDYGLGASLIVGMKNSYLWDMQFSLENSFFYLTEKKEAAEDFNLYRITAFISHQVYSISSYTVLVSAGAGSHFHFGDNLYKQPHMAVKVVNRFSLTKHFAVSFSPGLYSFSSNEDIMYYIDLPVLIQYSF